MGFLSVNLLQFSQDGRGDLPFKSKNAQNYLKYTGDTWDESAPSIVCSRALAIVALVASPPSVSDCPARVVTGVRSSQIAPDASSLLITLAVVASCGHVPDALSCRSTAQFARPLARPVSHRGASDISPLSSSWTAQAPCQKHCRGCKEQHCASHFSLSWAISENWAGFGEAGVGWPAVWSRMDLCQGLSFLVF